MQVATPEALTEPRQWSSGVAVWLAEWNNRKSTVAFVIEVVPPVAFVTWPLNVTLALVPVPADQNRLPV